MTRGIRRFQFHTNRGSVAFAAATLRKAFAQVQKDLPLGAGEYWKPEQYADSTYTATKWHHNDAMPA